MKFYRRPFDYQSCMLLLSPTNQDNNHCSNDRHNYGCYDRSADVNSQSRQRFLCTLLQFICDCCCSYESISGHSGWFRSKVFCSTRVLVLVSKTEEERREIPGRVPSTTPK